MKDIVLHEYCNEVIYPEDIKISLETKNIIACIYYTAYAGKRVYILRKNQDNYEWTDLSGYFILKGRQTIEKTLNVYIKCHHVKPIYFESVKEFGNWLKELDL